MEDSAPARNSPRDNEGSQHHRPSPKVGRRQHSKQPSKMDDDPSKKYVESESSVEDEVFENETTSRSTRETSPVFYLDPADWPRTHAMQSPVPSPLSQPHRWPLPFE